MVEVLEPPLPPQAANTKVKETEVSFLEGIAIMRVVNKR
jgi:hypothetical protein